MSATRRTLFGRVRRCEFVGLLCVLAPAGQAADPLVLWYDRPAAQWVEALPLGNGRLGAMVFGGIEQERIQLNEDTLWAGGPYSPVNPRAPAALPEIRRLLAAGEPRAAQDRAQADFMAEPLRQMPYQTLGDLLLTLPGGDRATQYRRELDLETATTVTTFRVGPIEHRREAFISPVDQVLVVRLSARDTRPGRRGALTLTVGLQSPHRSSSHAVDEGTLVLTGKNGDAPGVAGALRFEARVRVLNEGGTVTRGAAHLHVSGADHVTLLVAAATSFVRFDDVSGDPSARTSAAIAAAQKRTPAQLADAHGGEHRRLFGRVRLDLGGTAAAASRPTDVRIREAESRPDPGLVELYFQFGRYLLISSSRPGTQPANLQGIWNDNLQPPWESKYTLNINTQMNYWPAEVTNLAECAEPLLAMVDDLRATGASVAREHYGARGWVVHHNTNLWRAAAPVDGAFYGVWPTGGAWLALHAWEHYRFDPSPLNLRRAYDAMRGACEFFLDTLVPYRTTGWRVTSPSLSPENAHRPGVSLVEGPTMDHAILRELFDATLEAGRELGGDDGFLAGVDAARRALPPFQIGAGGQLQEWLEDLDESAPDRRHRHVSHLFGLHPGSQITPRATPELARAAQHSLETRGDFSTGWAIAWRLNLWARLGDGDRAERILRALLGPERTYPNLFDAHPPFQIDGNLGGTAGIAEMLLQSHAGELHTLPALPATWRRGRVTGLRARGGFEVDLAWDEGRLTAATIRSERETSGNLRVGERLYEFTTAPQNPYTWRPNREAEATTAGG